MTLVYICSENFAYTFDEGDVRFCMAVSVWHPCQASGDKSHLSDCISLGHGDLETCLEGSCRPEGRPNMQLRSSGCHCVQSVALPGRGG